jgi:hypothetical protein
MSVVTFRAAVFRFEWRACFTAAIGPANFKFNMSGNSESLDSAPLPWSASPDE